MVEKDLLIQEKEKLYMELKNILARQPGPEVAEQLSIYQANLREKTKQMKAMASELNMYQAQVGRPCVCVFGNGERLGSVQAQVVGMCYALGLASVLLRPTLHLPAPLGLPCPACPPGDLCPPLDPPVPQVNEYKYEIERLVRELNDMKRKYFEQKRREQMEKEKGLKPVLPPGPSSTVPRFTGGGFSLSQQP